MKRVVHFILIGLLLLSLNSCVASIAAKAVTLGIDAATSAPGAEKTIHVVEECQKLDREIPWAIAFSGLSIKTNLDWQREVLPAVIAKTEMKDCQIVNSVGKKEISVPGRYFLVFRVKNLDIRPSGKGKVYVAECFLEVYERDTYRKIGQIYGNSQDYTSIPGYSQAGQFTDLAVEMLNKHYFTN